MNHVARAIAQCTPARLRLFFIRMQISQPLAYCVYLCAYETGLLGRKGCTVALHHQPTFKQVCVQSGKLNILSHYRYPFIVVLHNKI